jgi:hypothetical protein
MRKDGMQEPDTTQFREAFTELPLFDDFYLQMQAMNLDIMDGFIETQEEELLRKYIDTERTPVPDALFVSALGQLWIFGMYELLRTWRQRVEQVSRFVTAYNSTPAGQKGTFMQEKRKKVKKLGKHALGSPWADFAKAIKSARYLERLNFAYDQSESAFRRIEALRISLAKHEIPKSKGAMALAPGYGRIDMTTGSIYWQVVLEGNEVDMISRRTIANQCRAFPTIPSKLLLSRPIQAKLAGFPKHSYGTKRVRAILKDGREVDGVIVAWDKLVVFVEGGKRRFNARHVVSVVSTPKKQPKMRLP